jgi:hypothetical protein
MDHDFSAPLPPAIALAPNGVAVFAVWLFLVAATVLTTWILPKDIANAHVSSVAILTIAAIKIRFVIRSFMEVRSAPLGWRIFFDLWIVGVTAMALLLYLHGPIGIR